VTAQTRPLHARLLRLHHVRLRGWHRAVLLDGSFVLAVLLVLADLASAWALLVLPAVVAALVKVHDVVAGLLPGARTPGTPTAPVQQDRRRRDDGED
jgi:hypothetical protein